MRAAAVSAWRADSNRSCRACGLTRRQGGIPLKNVLFTGYPGSGRTTLIKKAVRRLGDRAGGFYTDEPAGAGAFLRLVTLDGREAIVAGPEVDAPVQVGALRVDTEVFDGLAVSAIQSALEAGRVVIMDEIGPLQLASQGLAEVIQLALDGPNPVLGVLSLQEHPVLDAIRARRDTLVVPVTPGNRDQLLDRVWTGLRLPTESLADTQRRIDKQRERARRYAGTQRLTLTQAAGLVRGDHGTYQVSWQGEQWHCSCSFFLKYGTCAHTMAAEENLSSLLPAKQEDPGRK